MNLRNLAMTVKSGAICENASADTKLTYDFSKAAMHS